MCDGFRMAHGPFALITALAFLFELVAAPAAPAGRLEWETGQPAPAAGMGAYSRGTVEHVSLATRGACVVALRALRGGGGPASTFVRALGRKGPRRAKPWVRVEDYVPEARGGRPQDNGQGSAEQRRQESSGGQSGGGVRPQGAGSERGREKGPKDWYGIKAKKAAAKTKKWVQRRQEDRDEDSCDEPALELRGLYTKLEQLRDKMKLRDKIAGQSERGKLLAEKIALKHKVYLLAMKLGGKLERRKRFGEAHAAYCKAFSACPTRGRATKSREAMERAAMRSTDRKKKRQWRKFLTSHVSAAGGDRTPITLEALEKKKHELGVLSDKEALWYSVLLNETILGQPPPHQKLDPVTLQLPIARWIPPSLRRPNSFSSAASYSRPTRVSGKIAAAVARGATQVTYISDRVPRAIIDGSLWAYRKCALYIYAHTCMCVYTQTHKHTQTNDT